ncbi:unnamed protein product [Linum tenue]|uniref:Homeobox domain-containing protein n=1 Tax=Linum tenue TaxID=586396 RepID=A0AAV0MEE3_9ROSI|nr:unnamed protein product [Linum tenue]
MASSNRHWPSLFKSKPVVCNQRQHDVSNHHPRPSSSYSPLVGEERSPEPKPRWNPKPEQIRILESIFNSGMVNPPRDEIRKIRLQLQEFGHVGDANVFYWFQNRKSRTKHKLRNLHSPSPSAATSSSSKPLSTATSSSSSSSDNNNNKPSPRGSKRTLSSRNSSAPHHGVVSPQPHHSYLPAAHHHHDFFPGPEPFFPQGSTGVNVAAPFGQGFCFSEPAAVNVGPCTSLLLSDILSVDQAPTACRKLENHHGDVADDDDCTKKLHQLCYTLAPTVPSIGLGPPGGNLHLQSDGLGAATCNTTASNNTAAVLPSSLILNQFPGGGGDNVQPPAGVSEGGRSPTATVFINEVAIEVGAGPFNVREAFGDDVLLVHSSGQPVLTDEWGITLHSLHHGGFYYLLPFSTAHHI